MTEVELVKIVSEVLARKSDWFKPRREGFPQPLSRVLNNPGMLNAWRRNTAGVFEDTGLFSQYETTCGGFIQFPDPATGWMELHKNTKARICWQRATAQLRRDLCVLRGRRDRARTQRAPGIGQCRTRPPRRQCRDRLRADQLAGGGWLPRSTEGRCHHGRPARPRGKAVDRSQRHPPARSFTRKRGEMAKSGGRNGRLHLHRVTAGRWRERRCRVRPPPGSAH